MVAQWMQPVLLHWPHTTAAQAALRMQSHVLCWWPAVLSYVCRQVCCVVRVVRAATLRDSAECVRAALGTVRASFGGFKRLRVRWGRVTSNSSRFVKRHGARLGVVPCHLSLLLMSAQRCSAVADVCVCVPLAGVPCVGRSVCVAVVCFTGLRSPCTIVQVVAGTFARLGVCRHAAAVQWQVPPTVLSLGVVCRPPSQASVSRVRPRVPLCRLCLFLLLLRRTNSSS